MKTPPLLLAAALLFWGWQVGLPVVGAVLAVILEGLRLTRIRWDWTDEDFNRLWNFCTLIFIAAAVYAFTANEGPAAFGNLVQDASFNAQRAAGETSQKTAISLIQWMPMIFFPFLAVLVLNRRDAVKLSVFSLIARQQKKHRVRSALADFEVSSGWSYFGACLISASINTNTGYGFFGGLSGLLMWALWTRRSRRFALPVWVVTVLIACTLGLVGQQQLGELRRWVESYTPAWPWRWSGHRTNPNESNTTIGQIGRMKGSGTIVIRVEARDGLSAPSLLRTASYRHYNSPGRWNAAATGGRDTGGNEIFSDVTSPPNSGSWPLRAQNLPQIVNIASYLDGGVDMLPLPLGVGRLENCPAFTIKTNGLGAVQAQGPGLILFDAHYGPVGSIDSPPSPAGATNSADFQIPALELPAVEKIVAAMNFTGQTTNQMMRTVSAYFQDHFTYGPWQERRSSRRDTNGTALASFLLQTHQGHCEYFATATVLVLRRLGIPARYAVGWSVQEASGKGYVVRERHAHAWCLAYYNGQWHDFDTTPASWSAEEASHASPLQFLSDLWSRLKFEFMKLRHGQSNLRDYVWWIIGPLLLFLVYRLARKPLGRRRAGQTAAAGRSLQRHGLDSEFYLVEKKLAEFGFVRPPGETLGQFLNRAARDARIGALNETLPVLLRLHYRLRFDPPGLDETEREAFRRSVHEIIERLGRHNTVR